MNFHYYLCPLLYKIYNLIKDFHIFKSTSFLPHRIVIDSDKVITSVLFLSKTSLLILVNLMLIPPSANRVSFMNRQRGTQRFGSVVYRGYDVTIDICVLRKESRFQERILNFRYIFGTIGLSTRTTVSDKLNAMFRGQHDINMNLLSNISNIFSMICVLMTQIKSFLFFIV